MRKKVCTVEGQESVDIIRMLNKMGHSFLENDWKLNFYLDSSSNNDFKRTKRKRPVKKKASRYTATRLKDDKVNVIFD